jgi:hypothetical protein
MVGGDPISDLDRGSLRLAAAWEAGRSARSQRDAGHAPLCTRDLATPFISKDGRYVIAHDGGDATLPGTLKNFEITGDPASHATTCERRGAGREVFLANVFADPGVCVVMWGDEAMTTPHW